MNEFKVVFAPAVVYLKTNAVRIFLRWMPFIFFGLVVGAEYITGSRIAHLGLLLLIVSTITLVLDVEGKLPQIPPPFGPPPSNPTL